MKLPDRIVIAGQPFAVTFEPPESLNGADARFNPSGQRIRVSNALGPDSTRESVLHEVIHGIRASAALPRREREVTAMGAQLFDTLRRNPELVAWLMEDTDAAQEGSGQEGDQQEHRDAGPRRQTAEAGGGDRNGRVEEGQEAEGLSVCTCQPQLGNAHRRGCPVLAGYDLESGTRS